MKTWQVTTKEKIDDQIVTRTYEFDALDYPGARTRSWHIDGHVESIVNKNDPAEKYADVTVQSWSSGIKPQPVVSDPHKDHTSPGTGTGTSTGTETGTSAHGTGA